nr:hypothetical protein [Streptomyces sp. CBMA152]
MPPTPLPDGTVRPSAVVNEEIRRLWEHAPLTPADEEHYRWLLVEWAEATRREAARGSVSPAA